MRRTLLFALLPLLLQPVLPAQATYTAAWLDRAEKAGAADDPRQAASHLRKALLLLGAVEDREKLAELHARAMELRRKFDPLWQARRNAEMKAARYLLELAEKYRKRKWYRTARRLMRRAAVLDPAAALPLLADLEKSSPLAEEDPILRWFKGGQEVGHRKGWKVTCNRIVSPPPDGNSNGLLSTRVLEREARVSLEVKMEKGRTGAVVRVGISDKGDFLSMVFLQLEKRSFIKLRRVKSWIHGTDLGHVEIPGKLQNRGGWQPITILVKRDEVRVSACGCEPFVHKIEAGEAFGRLSVGTHEFSGEGDPLHVFRNFKVEPL